MFAILGAGFGLYGYLPALLSERAGPVILPERSRTRFEARSELRRYADEVRWAADEASALSSCRGAVLALNPEAQADYIPQCLARSNVAHLLLEKPLAPSPLAAREMFDLLISTKKKFRIGYTFRHTTWGDRLLAAGLSGKLEGRLRIRWKFMAHHFRHNLRNWKRRNASGGGVVRFYGIHIIALLSEIGYRDVAMSQTSGTTPGEDERWSAVFTGPDLPDCDVAIDARSAVNQFEVRTVSLMGRQSGELFANLSDPYNTADEHPIAGEDDVRVEALARFCRTALIDDAEPYGWYAAANVNWAKVERLTLHSRGPIPII